jgi:hypothetical protein
VCQRLRLGRTKVRRRFPQRRESVHFARSPRDEPISGPHYLREMPVNAPIWLLFLENRDNRDSVAERVGFELSVTFEISLRKLAPCLAHNSIPKEKILNQREFLGFESAYRISLIPFMLDVIDDALITSNTATFARRIDCPHQGETRRRSPQSYPPGYTIVSA